MVHLRDAPQEAWGYSCFSARTYPTEKQRGGLMYQDFDRGSARERTAERGEGGGSVRLQWLRAQDVPDREAEGWADVPGLRPRIGQGADGADAQRGRAQPSGCP